MARPRRLTLSELGVDPLSDMADAQSQHGSEIASPLTEKDESNPFPWTEQPKPGRLYAIADLHLSYPGNREEWAKLRYFPNDGLIICGDVGETGEHLNLAFSLATERFRQVWWTPGNHELYTLPSETEKDRKRGEAKYEECVHIARAHGVLTPEDAFSVWEGEGGPSVVAPIFTLYDYSFRPDNVTLEGALDWAREENVEATDEHLLHYDPYDSRQQWCSVLVKKFKRKLEETQAANPSVPIVIVNHWPLREDLVLLRNVPRFSIWCGTKKTTDWHKVRLARFLNGEWHEETDMSMTDIWRKGRRERTSARAAD
jgi:hypothetical protein